MATVIGPSTTQLFSNLSQILDIPPKSEFVLSAVDHEANTSPWVRLAKLQGHQVKWWKPESTDGDLLLTPANLKPLLSSNTKFVSCTHTSNVLGGIQDIKAIAETVHSVPGAMLCVDGVALAPHREIDVKELGVDFYSFSWYKVSFRPPKSDNLWQRSKLGRGCEPDFHPRLTRLAGLWPTHCYPVRFSHYLEDSG